jgi:CubicO group peptidase (beta-lactamase class C family)
MAEIDGFCDDRFQAVRQVLSTNLDSGADLGASVAISLDGELVVDMWGGWADQARTQPWQRDTITNVWSTTKTMAALCALMLADRGEIDFDAPVAKYWPEFAAEGKEGVCVRHLMSHTAGLPGWTAPMAPEDLYDWEKATSALAAQAPWWEPGTKSGYHALTQGYLVGEVCRRVTGQSLGTFFAQEVAGPLKADFHIGLPAEHDRRVSPVVPPVTPLVAPEGLAPDSIAVRALSNPLVGAEQSWEEGWRRAEIPAANGHGNARSVAMIQGAVACSGEVGGVRLLSPEGVNAIFRVQARGVDLVLGAPLCLGIGYGLNSDEMPISPNPRTCFWGGWGGSVVLVDVDARMVVAYMMNKMGEGTLGDDRGIGVILNAYAGLAGSGS